MKKGIKESNVQRMRNLVTGKHSAKTKIRSGYTTAKKSRSEGDVWEQDGKKWTIKDGIKRTINKLDSARKAYSVPLSCPKCDNEKLNHKVHKAMYRRWGMCFTCVTKWEHKMKKDGTYDAWYKQFDESNFNAYIDDIQKEYNEWLQGRNSEQFITEAGDIEDWSGGKSNEELSKEFKEQIKKVMESRGE